jgi:hypothetical protein
MITRLQNVLPDRPLTPAPEPPGAKILITHRDVQDDVVYWCGIGNGHDGQGWTAECREALEFTAWRDAAAERRIAKWWHPTMRVGMERAP